MVFWKKKVEAAADPPEVDEAAGGGKDSTSKAEANKGISKIDFILRLMAAIATLGSAVAMATTTHQSFSIFSQFINFKDEFRRLPTFSFFLVINSIACGYLVLSLVLSIFHIFKSAVKVTRAVLIIFDTVMLAFLTAGASAAAAIVHLAHKGNAEVNWVAICQQFNSFCERASGTLVGSFIAILALLLLIVLSAIALSRG